MKPIILMVKFLSLLIVCFSNLNCPDRYDKSSFPWDGIINGRDEMWWMHCNNACAICTATTYADRTIKIILHGEDTTTYKDVFDDCKGRPNRWAPVTPADTTDENPIFTGKLLINGHDINNINGFDDWHNTNSNVKISYLSIKAGGSNAFWVTIPDSLIHAFNQVVVVIPDAARNKLSFHSSELLDTIDLYCGDNQREIYARIGAPVDTALSINIYGISDPKKPVCLAGDCYGSEDNFKVVVYNEKVYNNYIVYLMNSPAYRTDSITLANGFNRIIQQGVLKMSNINIRSITDWTWDKNGSQAFDVFASYVSVPVEYIEYFDLLNAVGEYNQGCDVDQYPATIVLNGKMRYHWLLTEDLIAGENIIPLNSVKNLQAGTDQYLGSWFGETSVFEWIHIESIDTLIKCITISAPGLRNPHKKNESFYDENIQLGFTTKSCSCVNDNPDIKTIVHEFLHQNIIGGLDHVDNNDNIMFYANQGMVSSTMRYRQLDGENGFQYQWHQLTR